MKRLSNNKGFTLIELLVVITLIAILAVAILAAINPVEQRRKAQDTGARAAATELQGALDRYYATYGCYPWESTAVGVCGPAAPANAISVANVGMTYLEEAGEVKTSLNEKLTDSTAGTEISSIRVTKTADDLIIVCFAPVSKTYIAQADSDASGGGTATTHICIN